LNGDSLNRCDYAAFARERALTIAAAVSHQAVKKSLAGHPILFQNR